MMNNSRTEPGLATVTPSKPIPSTGLATPQTGNRFQSGSPNVRTPYTTPSKISGNGAKYQKDAQATAATTDGSDEEFYDWPASDEEELGKAADEASSNQSSLSLGDKMPPPPETPRKAIKTDMLTTPGKQQLEDMACEAKAYATPASAINGDDVFATPSTTAKRGMGLFASNMGNLESPAETPTPIRYKDVPSGADTELATDILATLASHAVALHPDAREAVKSICNRHVLYTRGITKGRDVSRTMVKTKDDKIVEMQAEIEGLRSERETNRAVIRHLRRDVAQRKENRG